MKSNMAPEVEFEASPIINCAGADISFIDLSTSTDSITNWLWNFGNDTTSNLQNPIYQYQLTGVYDVTLIARGKHYEQIIKNGLEVESFWGNFNLKIPCFNNVENLESFDLIFLTTKLYSNNQSIKDIKKISDSETIIITIQNGVNSHNEISKEIKSKNIIPAATYIEAEIPAPGVVLQKGSSVIIEMGELNGEITKRIKEIKNTFSVEELTINISKNILSTLWKKMIIVGSFGTIMSSFRASFVDLINSNYGEDILMQTMKEILSVGIADGINLSDVDINQNILDLKKLCKFTVFHVFITFIQPRPYQYKNDIHDLSTRLFMKKELFVFG
jgi:2-dehydropantoate 2-reductase